MKIVHVVNSLEVGGAEVLVGQLCRIQRAGGHDVTVCALSKRGAIGEALLAEGFDVRVMGKAAAARTMLRYFQLFRAMKPDVVHCHNVAPTVQAALGARLAGVGSIGSTRHSLVKPPYEMLTEIKYSVFTGFCHWVAGICEITCENLRGAPLARTNKIVRVYNGTVGVERMSVEGLGKHGFTLVFIGRLAAVKDLKTLIRAVVVAAERVPELALWIVGDGPVRADLEALVGELRAGERVRFWGQRMDTAQFFSAADAFVMSSVSEGLPMSLLQAMSLGVPAVVTDVGGMAEVVKLAGCGLLASVGDVTGMADAIVRLAGDAGLREKLSRRAFAAYEERFTLEKMDAAYLELYQR